MGRAVERAAGETSGFEIRVRIDRPECIPPPSARGAGEVWGDSPEAVDQGDVVVDFSAGPGTCAAARACAGRGAGLVSGTTGLDRAAEEELKAASRRVAVLRASNFSIGIAALRRALRETMAALPASWDIEIVERHHRGKADSPSGTALQLAGDAAAGRGLAAEALRFGREGRVGPRPAAEIGVHAVRGGTWVGDHAVLLAGEGEWIELRHVASDRQAFAFGALAAARYIATAPPGFYTMDDVVDQRR
jgi:4-hydroxy-tetrahydrodipicolinate reductase